MPYQFWAAIAVIVLVVIYGKLTEHMRARGIPVPGEDEPEKEVIFEALRPHICPKGENFMPTMRSRRMKVGERAPISVPVMDPFGMSSFVVPDEVGAIVCEGVFCSGCDQRLMCRCGRTPVEDTILEDRKAEIKVLACCENPLFVESDVPTSISPLSVGQSYKGKNIGKA